LEGGEYKIVIIKDMVGNERIIEIKIPYIRQFENIAKKDDILVAAYYYHHSWHSLDRHWKEGFTGALLPG